MSTAENAGTSQPADQPRGRRHDQTQPRRRGRPQSRRAGRRLAPLAAVALVPLLIAGVVVGALADAEASLGRIPAAIVNADELVQQAQPDGTTTPVFAGRQLVTELTAPSTGSADSAFDWRITNADDAAQMLADGTVYAVLVVPRDFSRSILSLQSPKPKQASLSIRTDDAHSYLSATVADAVGSGLVSAFGEQITTRYLTGVYDSFGTVGTSLSTAADGAGSLQSGATELQAGLGSLADGAAEASTGAQSLSSGLSQYTAGVGSLGSGLQQLQTGSAQLGSVSSGISTFTSGVAQLSAGIAAASAQLTDADPSNDAVASATLAALSSQLTSAAAGGPALAAGAASGISGVQSGIAQSASGARRLSAGAPALTSGASSLASGVGALASGAVSAQSGAGELSTGAGTLATGLRDGATQLPSLDGPATDDLASVVASPIALTVVRDNPASDLGSMLATIVIPLALWLGALAIFAAARPITGTVLSSTARTSRLLGSRLARASLIALAQTIPLVVLLHTALGVDWALLPVSFLLVFVTALVFAAVHLMLFLLIPRAAVILSVVLLALQVTAAGAIYPIELLAVPVAALNPMLPFTYAVSGMQALVTVGGGASLASAVVAMLLFGVAAVGVSAIALGRRRTIGFRRLAIA